MSAINVFVKLGGSFITDKAVAESLNGPRITAAARMMRKALGQDRRIRMVLGHGGGSYGHIAAKKYGAVAGIHPKHGWEGLYKIRESMTRMNLLFVKHCNKGGLFPVTVSPFAVAQAKDGVVSRLDARNIQALLDQGRIPLIHGDAILDSERGFTIASTEALLQALSRHIRFDRIVMATGTDGVLDRDGSTIERLRRGDIHDLGARGAADVTGGMRGKVAALLSLITSGRAGESRILRCDARAQNLYEAILGIGGGGTLLKP